ncbi:hypothetical protein Lal_00002207 [Lupinus albus]|nr:hypothetical protein Lal_00002207 [Lupinus albus]
MDGIVNMTRGYWHWEVRVTQWIAVCPCSIEALSRQSNKGQSGAQGFHLVRFGGRGAQPYSHKRGECFP